jgi:hypothetical protein
MNNKSIVIALLCIGMICLLSAMYLAVTGLTHSNEQMIEHGPYSPTTPDDRLRSTAAWILGTIGIVFGLGGLKIGGLPI